MILSLPVGPVQANCWIYGNETTREAFAVDPGEEAAKILETLRREGLRLTHIFLTHGHFDHIGAADALRRVTGAKVYAHAEAAEEIGSAVGSGYAFFFGDDGFRPLTADVLLQEGEPVNAAGLTLTVLHTPGHSRGSCCYDSGELLWTGDTLFAGTYGRTDLPGGSSAGLRASLLRLAGLPGDRRVFPGHMQETALERERRSNPGMQE